MKVKFPKITPDFYCIFFIVIVVCLYFGRLFYPQISIFVTPDVSLSDVLNLNYSLKTLLSESLKSGQFPFWSRDILNGFPVAAESQIGAFSPINILFFYFLPTPIAFNLTYVFSFLLAGISMYYLLKNLGLKPLSSLFGATTFIFSGPVVFQITHTNLLQAISFLPLIFLLTVRLCQKPSLAKTALLAIVISLQFLSGFVQTTFITLILISSYIIFFVFSENKFKINKLFFSQKIFLYYIFSIILFLGLCSVSILPTIEYTKHSTRKLGINSSAGLQHSFNYKTLITIISPFYYENLTKGFFRRSSIANDALFWESNAYMGIVPPFFLLLLLLNIRRLKSKLILFAVIIASGSFLLMLGKYSPLYLIFSFPPFSFFRAPVRFILLFSFCLIIISSYGFNFILDKLKNNNKVINKYLLILQGVLITISTIEISLATYNYHLILPVSEVNKVPKTAEFLIANRPKNRYFSLGGEIIWRNELIKNGFSNTDLFYFFRNDLSPDLNLLFNLPSARGFAISNFFLLRKIVVENQIFNDVLEDINIYDQINIDPSTINLLKIYGVDYIVSPFNLTADGLKKKFETSKYKKISYKIYQLVDSPPVLNFVSKYYAVDTLEESLNKLSGNDFNPKTEVIINKEVGNLPLSTKISLEINQDTDIRLEANTKGEKNGLLVYSNTYYPGWKAYIDGKETEIYIANIASQAILIPKGEHRILFEYKSTSFIQGLYISCLSLLINIALLITYKIKSGSNFKGVKNDNREFQPKNKQ